MLRNGTKAFLRQNFSLFLVKFKKLGFSAPLRTKQLEAKLIFHHKTIFKFLSKHNTEISTK